MKNSKTPKSSNSHKRTSNNSKLRGKQGSKDSNTKRVNFDNTRASKFKEAVDKMSTDKKPSNNDVSWYAKNPHMLAAAGSIPFASVAGAPIPIGEVTDVLPGVMTFYYSPTLGMDIPSENANDNASDPQYAVNQAGKFNYSFTVHANSRNYSYEYQDQMILELAGASLFSLIAHMVRAYGVSRTYSEQNRYLPESVLTAMGFYPSDIRIKLSAMWFDINELIARTSQIWIPNTMPLLQRWFWLNSNIFKDDNDVKGQIYMFVQSNYWMYNETLTSSGGGLQPAFINGKIFNPSASTYMWQEWMDMANSMINALINSEDRGIIFGDILNAYGMDKLYAISPIPVDYRVEPVYNQEVMTQIENLISVEGSQCLGIFQTADGIHQAWSPRAVNKNGGLTTPSLRNNGVLNFHFPTNPTPADIIVATRLTAMDNNYLRGYVFLYEGGTSSTPLSVKLVNAPANTFCNAPKICGSEVVNNITVMQVNPKTGESVSIDVLQYKYDLTVEGDQINDPLAYFSAFDWHPFIYQIRYGGSYAGIGDYIQATKAFGDYANYTTISKAMLRKLHVTALYSLFGIEE